MFAGIATMLGGVGRYASGLLAAQARSAEFNDQIRQMEFKKSQTVGLATALAGGSGLTLDSRSTQDYLASLTASFDDRIGKLQAAKRRARLIDNFSAATAFFSAGVGGLGMMGQESGDPGGSVDV